MVRNWLQRLLGSRRRRKEERQGQEAEIKWLAPSDNPWGVPVLDLRPYTLTSISFSTDKRCAENAISFSGDGGLSFAGVTPDVSRFASGNLRYRVDGVLADGVLFAPQEMEQKWALFYHGGQIICVRSWLREVTAVAGVRIDGGFAHISSIQGFLCSEDEDSALTFRLLDYLLRSHALDTWYPVPLPEGLEKVPQDAASWAASLAGNRALFATPHIIDEGPPERPLRTVSLLHIAVARGDTGAVDVLLQSGHPIEILGRDGLAPLHWSLAAEGTGMLEHLLARGAAVDTRSDEGATPLMNAVQDATLEKTQVLLDNGADPNAKDLRGFTSLHRAAERGEAKLVRLLLDRGAEPAPEIDGHTPRSLAEAKGHKAVLKLLTR